MRIPRVLTATTLVLVALTTVSSFAAPPVPEVIPGHVRATLISDVSRIRAGRPFTIGVYLEIERGFHVYWTNPGDIGMPTTVSFTVPEGYTVTPDPFPIPRRLQQSGKEVVYGYESAVVFTARVTPPDDLRIGEKVTMEATAAWLVCDKATCMPGKTAMTMTMKVADHQGPTNVDAFQRYGSTVAGPKDRLEDLAGIQSTLDSATHTATLTLHWKTAGSGVQIFPGADEAVKIDKVTVQKTENDLTPIVIKFEVLPGQKLVSNRLPVLIAFRARDGHMRGIQAGIPLK
jgi:DsbC/DsbD-like thiol-disulfide interchange protein